MVYTAPCATKGPQGRGLGEAVPRRLSGFGVQRSRGPPCGLGDRGERVQDCPPRPSASSVECAHLETPIIQRAFELVDTGAYRTITEIKGALQAEGYDHPSVQSHLSGLAMRRVLKERLKRAGR